MDYSKKKWLVSVPVLSVFVLRSCTDTIRKRFLMCSVGDSRGKKRRIFSLI